MRPGERRRRLAVARRLKRRHLLGRAARCRLPGVMAVFRPEIDDVIRRLDRVETALDHGRRVTLGELAEAHVVLAALELAELAGDLHSLCRAVGESCRRVTDLDAPEPKVVEQRDLATDLERVLTVARTFASRAEELDPGHET